MKEVLRRSDIRACKKLQKKHGKSYYFATLLFPKDVRQATQALYAFFRVPDEIVDNPAHKVPSDIRRELRTFEKEWRRAYKLGDTYVLSRAEREKPGRTLWEPVLRASAIVFHRYDIPFAYSESFLAAMVQDVDKTRYATYAELEKYMYGSAAVVGLMMAHVIGFSDKRALVYAEELGYAMQLTNFLRDIKEDFAERGRIYLPQKDIAAFDLHERDVAEGKMSDMLRRFLAFEASRARALYASADEGVALLDERGRRAVRVAAVLYEAILDKIEAARFDVYQKRLHTTFLEKCRLAQSVWKHPPKRNEPSLSAAVSVDLDLPESSDEPAIR